MNPHLREKFLILVDNVPENIGASYEISKYRDAFKIVNYLVKSGLKGRNLKSKLLEMGVVNFDDSIQVSRTVKKLVIEISKRAKVEMV